MGRDPEIGKRSRKRYEGAFVEPTKLSLKDYMVQWLEIKRVIIEKNTYVSYNSNITHHVIPSIGIIALHKLNVMHIQKCY
ncbi:site-specific integrase, partial [Bacillus sp. TE8-1]